MHVDSGSTHLSVFNEQAGFNFTAHIINVREVIMNAVNFTLVKENDAEIIENSSNQQHEET